MPTISPRQPAIPNRTSRPGQPARQAHSLAGHGRCSWSSHIPLQWPRSSLMAQPMMGTGTLLIAPVQRSAPERCPRPLFPFMPERRFRSGRRLGPGPVSCHGCGARHCLMHAVFYLHAVLFACPMRLSTALTTLITWHFLAQPGLQISRLSGKRGGSFGNVALLVEDCRQQGCSKVAGAFRYDSGE